MLKLDKSFIDTIASSAEQHAVVDMHRATRPRHCNLQIVAEGIETEAERDLLVAMGCHLGQGYLFSRPLSYGDASQWLLEEASRASTGKSDGGLRAFGGPVLNHLAAAVDHDPRLQRHRPAAHRTRMYDAVIDEVDGRRIRVGEHWLDRLGLVQLPRLRPRAADHRRGRGAGAPLGHPPELVADAGQPALYPQIEERLAELLGAPDTLVLPTITQIHLSVIPVLARQGTLLVDARAHKTI